MIKCKYVQHMGDDLTVVNSARISMNRSSDTLNERDIKLIDYLAKNKHLSPFEHCSTTLWIQVPLYIRSQIMRHRSFSFNEISRRFSSESIEFFEPNVFRNQHKSAKQCSDGKMSDNENLKASIIFQSIHQKCYNEYKRLIEMGVARELARGILPQNLLTQFVMTGNLRNWIHFIKLRDHEHAQVEVQILAKDILRELKTLYPHSVEALNKYYQ